MGMYCACGWKMTGCLHIDCVKKESTYYEPDPDGCTCDWKGWISRYDWPPQRKNKSLDFGEPNEEGSYLVRVQSSCGDRYEEEQNYSKTARKVVCGYTGREFLVHWSGDDESQPYAWRKSE